MRRSYSISIVSVLWTMSGLYGLDLEAMVPTEASANRQWETEKGPLLFKTHPSFQQWAAARWTSYHFMESIRGQLTNTYISESAYFPYFDSTAMETSFFRKSFVEPFAIQNVDKDTFFSSSTNETLVHKLYSGNVLLPTFSDLKSAISPGLFSKSPLTATVWMGTPGSQSPAHHDLAFNVYIQLFGVKRFTLLPHGSAQHLCIHGRYHPHSRQSRYVDLRSSTIVETTRQSDSNAHSTALNLTLRRDVIATHCSLAAVEGLEVTLRPGNVLFLPPFWYHEVLSVNDSVSISLWWDSEEILDLINDLYEIPLPFEWSWPPHAMLSAVFFFSEMLLSRTEVALLTRAEMFSGSKHKETNISHHNAHEAHEPINISVVHRMMKMRYLEDYLVTSEKDCESFLEEYYPSIEVQSVPTHINKTVLVNLLAVTLGWNLSEHAVDNRGYEELLRPSNEFFISELFASRVDLIIEKYMKMADILFPPSESRNNSGTKTNKYYNLNKKERLGVVKKEDHGPLPPAAGSTLSTTDREDEQSGDTRSSNRNEDDAVVMQEKKKEFFHSSSLSKRILLEQEGAFMSHGASAVRSKVLDYIEELFYNFAAGSQISNRNNKVISFLVNIEHSDTIFFNT